MVGKEILHYKIIEPLGQGGMGIVYLAQDTKLDRQVAIKFLPGHIAAAAEERKRFEIEAKAAAALNHPNIATIYNIEESDDELFLVMEYISGTTLEEYIRTQSIVHQREALDIAIQIAEGLRAAHEKGIVHRDIKPSNIMLTEKGNVKIMDFGLAKIAGGNAAPLTKTGTTLGTVAYMSPEQTRGEDADPRTDIWSFAVVFYEMLAGRLPFDAEYDHAIMYDILNEEPQPINAHRDELPAVFQGIFNRALVKDPLKRYQDIGYFLLDLNQIKKGSGLIESQGLQTPPQKTSKISLYLISLFFIIIMAGSWWFFMSDKSEANEQNGKWENSIAVLPFKNISPDAEQEYFCDGMTEQIITSLSKLRSLKVIARTSVMKFKDTQKTIPEIAKELGVAHVLEGSIRKVGEQIRVTAQLIQADGGHHLWANDYDRELKDIFNVQDDVSGAIASALLKQLTDEETEDLKIKGTDNTEAYEYFLKGEYFHANRYFLTNKMEDFNTSENLFKKAIKLDPDYAQAYAGLADLYNTHYYFSTEKKKYLDLQENFINTAYNLDPASSEINRIKGWVYEAKGEIDLAYESFKKALEINPNNSQNNYAMGYFLSKHGLRHLTIEYYTKAIELDPLDPNNFWVRAINYRILGKIEMSTSDYQNALEIEANNINCLNGISKGFFLQKLYKEAEEYIKKSEAINPAAYDTKITWALFYAAQGYTEKAMNILEINEINSVFIRINIYCLSGQKEEALKLINKEPWTDYLRMLYHPYYKILRDSDDFKIALQKAKIEYDENLAKYGNVALNN